MLNRDAPDLGRLPRRLREFGRLVAADSPLYGRICAELSEDPTVLEILSVAPYEQPAANILLGAVQYLLLNGADPDLAAHYPGVAGTTATPAGNPVELFARLCRSEQERLEAIVTSRTVQTNEVRRCTALLPAFASAAGQADSPLALIEIGASAGLNLIFDRYRYDYGSGLTAGPESSSLLLTTELRSTGPLGIDPLPDVVWRRGIDLHPVDVIDDDSVLWARSALWPEQLDRVDRFEQAVAIARVDPPTLIAGDALDLLTETAAAAPDDATLVVFHSFVLNQFSPADRARLTNIIGEIGTLRPVDRIGMDMIGEGPASIIHTRVAAGTTRRHILGSADHHGSWLEWYQ